MKCPNCDRENRDVARFCQYCGALLAGAKTPESIDAEAQFSGVEPPAESPQGQIPGKTDLAKEDSPETPESIDGQDTAEPFSALKPAELPQTDRTPSGSLAPVDKDEMPPSTMKKTTSQ